VRPAFVAGYDTGGDRIANVTFASGGTDDIRANEGLYLGGGVSVLNASRNFEFLGTLNAKYQLISAHNGGVTWSRFPVDLLVFYRWTSFRAGGGLSYVISPRLKGSGEAAGIGATYDNALGALLQADYLLDKVSLGLRYTILDYKSPGVTVKSNGAGVTFGFTF
jgi:hypothetical protein